MERSNLSVTDWTYPQTTEQLAGHVNVFETNFLLCVLCATLTSSGYNAVSKILRDVRAQGQSVHGNVEKEMDSACLSLLTVANKQMPTTGS